jgi:hypothetical protein
MGLCGEARLANGLCLTTGLNTHSLQPPVPLRHMRAPRVRRSLASRQYARSVVISDAIGPKLTLIAYLSAAVRHPDIVHSFFGLLDRET